MPTYLIYALAHTIALAQANHKTWSKDIARLSAPVCQIIQESPRFEFNGSPVERIAHNINILDHHMDYDTFTQKHPELCISPGSACNAADGIPSHVLLAIGRTAEQAKHAYRITLSKDNTQDEMNYLISVMNQNL